MKVKDIIKNIEYYQVRISNFNEKDFYNGDMTKRSISKYRDKSTSPYTELTIWGDRCYLLDTKVNWLEMFYDFDIVTWSVKINGDEYSTKLILFIEVDHDAFNTLTDHILKVSCTFFDELKVISLKNSIRKNMTDIVYHRTKIANCRKDLNKNKKELEKLTTRKESL